jgi:pimeloyl-ACP methyl ester carboxylesterase
VVTLNARAPATSRSGSTSLRALWADGRLGFGVGVALVLVVALVAAWLTPRGPITTGQALGSMVGALVLGVAVGLATGRRWSALLAPLWFMVAFEIARRGVDGPTVDAIRLGSMYGMVAFVLGRVLHGVLVLAPMALGAVYGVELARRLGRDGTAALGPVGWIGAGLPTLVLVALGVAIAVPASTAPITGPDGAAAPGSVAELTTVRLGGHDQALMIRGRSVDNPVLLHLAGGPGGTDIGAMRYDVGLEHRFVVVTWDQRGVGKSYAALDPAGTHTVQQAVADTVELTNYLRERFSEERIFLAGNSWGTILGVLAVQQQPELYRAFIGTGQMVSTTATDRMFWEDTLAWADETGNAELAATLRANGPPPYDDVARYEVALSHEHDWNAYPELDLDKEMPGNLMVPENTLLDRLNGLRSFLDSFFVLYPQLRDIDLRQDATRLEVPVYMVVGRHEARGRAVPADEWFALLEAPSKERVVFEHSGHRPAFEEPAEFVSLMTRVVAETRDAPGS